jgi:hypothetical protein
MRAARPYRQIEQTPAGRGLDQLAQPAVLPLAEPHQVEMLALVPDPRDPRGAR